MSSENEEYYKTRRIIRDIVESNPIEGDADGITTTSSNSNNNNNGGNNNNNRETMKMYEAIIFSGPIVFTLIILFLFYFFYLRRHSVDWSSLRMRASSSAFTVSEDVGVSEVGLKKEIREMLPIIVFKESFSVKDTQCSVCLGDYQAEDKLQQIPGCGHTFHLNCIDHWLATHTTCPLCRLSLIIPSNTPPASEPDNNDNNQAGSRFDSTVNVDNYLQHNTLQVV